MKYREFQGKQISQLGFGAMRLPTDGEGWTAPINTKATEEMILCAYENGVNYYDSAYVYHGGNSEKVIGEIFNRNKIRDKINIATKLPTMPQFIEGDYNAFFNEQLERLGTDHVDFYLIHSLEAQKWEDLKKHGVLEFMDSLKKSSKISHIGFSFHDSYDSFVKILGDYDWEFCQIQMNFLDVDEQATLKGLEYAYEKKGIKVVIMEPLRGGKLLGIGGAELDKIKAETGYKEETAAKAAFNFLWNRPEILTVLSGMHRLSDVAENVKSAGEAEVGGQSEVEKAFLARLKEYIESKPSISCTACRYCVEGCPQNIDIPRAFSSYNEAVAFNAVKENAGMTKATNPNVGNCVECGQCEEVCPQHLQVPELLKKVCELFEIK
ncbi:MAG: aldo/keto reductase [Eubacteriaceae bacterium]|jgi:predicted aldo/keto reductase-like oxidoreductase|nr:aldo/keto reductase [Eubacteriaceae bacterium]